MIRAIEPGSIILSPTDARILYQAANLKALRTKSRIGDTALHRLLTAITVCAFTESVAVVGILPRQSVASEERGYWTTQELADAAGLSDRTIRLACSTGTIPATRPGNAWIIPADAATTYLAARRSS